MSLNRAQVAHALGRRPKPVCRRLREAGMFARPMASKHAVGRFLHICEDGLLRYGSRQRGHPGIPLARYTRQDRVREAAREKPMNAFRQERNPTWRPPAVLKGRTWMLLDEPFSRTLGETAGRLLEARS